jgi:hypothetical protein
VHREPGRPDRLGVSDAAVGHDGGRATGRRPQGEHVAERRGAGLAAGLDDDHLALPDGVEGPLLGVVAATVRGEQVLAVRHEPQGPGCPDERPAGHERADAVDVDVLQAPLAELC